MQQITALILCNLFSYSLTSLACKYFYFAQILKIIFMKWKARQYDFTSILKATGWLHMAHLDEAKFWKWKIAEAI